MFSLKAVLAKVIYAYGVDAIPVLTLRMVFALPFYIIVLLLSIRKRGIKKFSNKDWALLLVFGLLGYYLASLYDFIGLQYIKAGLERIILFSYPTLVIILSWIFLRRFPNRSQIIAIFITYIGILLCFQGEFSDLTIQGNIVKGSLYVFLAAICYASYLVGSEYLLPKFGVSLFTSLAMILACLAVMLHFSIVSTVSIFTYHPLVYVYSIIMAIFCTVLPSYLVSASIKELGANSFGIIASLGPVSTIILAFIILGESLSFIQMIGAVIVIFGIFIVSRNKSKS